MQMSETQDQERRRDRRHPASCEIRVWQLLVLSPDRKKEELTHARVQNISKGGVCVVTDRPIDGTYPIRCELIISEVPVPLPLIMKVRWTQPIARGREHTIGLQFLL